jgi:hypothetical protein
MAEYPGTENAAYLSFRLLNSLIDLLRAKGTLNDAEVVALLEKMADDASKDYRAVGQRNAGYVRDTMIPEHKIVK